jgi:hypothetical protein
MLRGLAGDETAVSAVRGRTQGEGRSMSERETALKAGDELIIREGNGIERRVRYIGVRDGRKRYAVRNTSTGRLSYIHPQDPRARCASSRTPLARIPAEPTHVVPLAICMEAQRCAAQNGRIDPDYLVGLYRRKI